MLNIPKNQILLLLKELRLLEQLPEGISENISANKTIIEQRNYPIIKHIPTIFVTTGCIIWPCNTEQYSLVSHSSPSQPLEQKHLNESTSSIHVPPFLQGFPRQSLISETESQQLLLKAVFTYSEEWSTLVPLGKAAQSYYCICACKRKAQTSAFKPGRGFWLYCLSCSKLSSTRALHLPGKNIQGFKNTQTSNTSPGPLFVFSFWRALWLVRLCIKVVATETFTLKLD